MLKISIAFPAVFPALLKQGFHELWSMHTSIFLPSPTLLFVLQHYPDPCWSQWPPQQWQACTNMRKKPALVPSSFSSLRCHIFISNLIKKQHRKGACHNHFLPKKGRTLCYDVGRTDISCCNYFLCIVQGCSEILVEILEIGYEVILTDAHSTKMWVSSSFPFWEKKKVVFWKLQRAS